MKKRLDQYLFDSGLVVPIERARGLIMTGQVLLNDRPVLKPGTTVSGKDVVRVKGGNDKKWVSRGGQKLAAALKTWNIDPSNMICLDVGSSTGGFTDVLLQHGAVKVYALDVGYGILDWKLASNPQVVVMDRFNIRNLKPNHIPDRIDFLTTDVSFISLTKALPPALATLKTGGIGVALIKPQFELAKDLISQGGVVHDPQLHQQAINSILDHAKEWNITPIATTPSPITGPKGNREFLFYYSKLVNS